MKSKASFCMQYKKPEVATGSVLKKKIVLKNSYYKICLVKFAVKNLEKFLRRNSFLIKSQARSLQRYLK